MTLPDSSRRVLLRRYMALLERWSLLGERLLLSAWRDVPGYGAANVADFERLGASIVPLLNRSASLTTAHVSAVLEVPVTATPQIVQPKWGDPFHVMWAGFAGGDDFAAAFGKAESVAGSIGRDAVISTARRAGDSVESDDIIGWRRVLDSDPCDWCVMVSQKVYLSATTADFGHERCACGVDVVTR